MSKLCVICNQGGKYKCPTCLVYYCSVDCCHKHREEGCVLAKIEEEQPPPEPKEYVTESTVNKNKLELLRGDKDLKELLKNPHLRDLLVTVDKSDNPEEIMQKAMQEPLFVEFADACLKVVEPHTD